VSIGILDTDPPVPDGFAAYTPDKLVQICTGPSGLYALSERGELFFRELDPRIQNDGRGSQRFRWVPIEGPPL
jgi:hypothetical protein